MKPKGRDDLIPASGTVKGIAAAGGGGGGVSWVIMLKGGRLCYTCGGV